MDKNINNTNLETENSSPAGDNSENITPTYTSPLYVTFQNFFGTTRLYHIEIDSSNSDMRVMEKIRKRYFATMSMETRDIESQEDGFEVDVTDVQMANPFLNNGLRNPSRMKPVQGSIHRHIAFAMHPKQTAGGAAAGQNQESTKDLPVDRFEEKSREKAEDTTNSATDGAAQDSIALSTQLRSQRNTAETAERARKETAERGDNKTTRVSSKDSTVDCAKGIPRETSEDSTKGTIQSAFADIAAETPDKASKEVVESAINETAEDFVKGTAEATVESTTAESNDRDSKRTVGESGKHSPGYRAEGTSGKTAESIITETADRPSKKFVKRAINKTAIEFSKDSPVTRAEGTSRETAEIATVETTDRANKETSGGFNEYSQVICAEGTYASRADAERTTVNIITESSQVDAHGDLHHVLLVRTVWSRKAFCYIVFGSIGAGVISGIATGILTKSIQNGAAVGSIVFALIPALQSLIVKKSL
ncbi:hypothetical protein RUND412_009384 [Rhizina undulata]